MSLSAFAEDGSPVQRTDSVSRAIGAGVVADRELVERVHSIHHHDACPVYRSIHRAIDISTAVRLVG